MSTLILVRHGQSQWNLENRFTGWTDVPLTPQGEADAAKVAEALKGMPKPIHAFASRLIRSQQTLDAILKGTGWTDVPVDYDSALNERHYGDLQGLNKAETATQYGQEQVKLWRRSYDTAPPGGESMADCERRTTPFFLQYVLPLLEKGDVLIAAHGNSLRPIMKWLENLDKDAAATREIGLVTPYVYEIEGGKMKSMRVVEVPGIVTVGSSVTEKTTG